MSLALRVPAIAFLAVLATTATPLKLDYEGPPTRIPLPGGTNFVIPHRHVGSVDYKVGKANWRVSLDPDPPTYTRAAGASYLDILKQDFPAKDGWSYLQSPNELADNSLTVHHYEALAGNGQAGMVFELVTANTPADLHWILLATSNHKLGAAHGTRESQVITGGVSPYYDERYTGSSSAAFFSYLTTREWEKPHEWKGQLLLVTGPAVTRYGITPGAVTIHGAIEFGWKNFCTDAPKPAPRMSGVSAANDCPLCACGGSEVPEPSTAALFSLALVPLLFALRRRIASSAAVALAAVLAVAAAGPITTGYTGGPSSFTSVTWKNGGGTKENIPNRYGHGFKESEQYDIRVAGGTAKWETRLQPLVPIGDKKGPESIGAAGDAKYLDQLKKEFSAADGWSYAFSDTALGEGSFIVHDYIAHGAANLVGAEFMVEYKPGGALPANIHWIQVIKNNHKRDADHGVEEYTVDRGRGLSPYYDETGVSGFNDLAAPTSFFLYDYPFRNDGNKEHKWTAELYLVTGPERTRYGITPGAVNILGGIRWGWENSCVAPAPKGQGSPFETAAGDACSFTPVPEPGTAALAVLGLAMLLLSRLGPPLRLRLAQRAFRHSSN